MATVDLQSSAREESLEITPPWLVKKKSKKEKEEWFEKTKTALEKVSEGRIQTHVNNILWYTGEYDRTMEYRLVVPGQAERPVSRRVLPRIFSHLYDITEQRVSKLSALKPSFDVVPTNNEQSDQKQARLYKLALDAVARRSNMDFLMQAVERWCAVCGEVLVSVEYNEDIGDRVSKKSYKRVGDVEIKLKAPWTWLPAPARSRDDVTWGIDIVEVIHIEEARKKYKKPSLKQDNKRYIYHFNQDIAEKREDEIVIYRVIEIPNRYDEEGYVAYFASGELLEEAEEYPYSHYGFPFEWHTDIDIPGRLFPVSFYQHLQPIQHVYNRLTSIMVRNALLVGHPHILLPKGSAKIESFGNAPTAIEWVGAVEPKVVTFNSIPREFFELRKEVRDEMGMIGGIQGSSRGAPPSNTRAASMLRFYEEQEQQRASTQIIKHNELIRRIYIKAASVIGDKYPVTSRDRLIRVVGRENQYLIEKFAGSKPSAEYDVIIMNSTGFSESKAGRLEEIQIIEQVSPGLLSPEQKADVLELRNTGKAYDIMTAALRHAERENDAFIDGIDVPLPKPHQDLIVHWRAHVILLNSAMWEEKVPQEFKEKAYDHILVTERLMEEKASKNDAFKQALSTLAGYPIFWEISPQPQPTPVAGPQAPQPPQAQSLPPAIPQGMESGPPTVGEGNVQ